MLRKFLVLLAVVAVSFAAPVMSAESCISDWGAAGDIVRQQGLKTVEQLVNGPASPLPGTIVKATLCRQDSGYVYRLVVRDGRGQLKNVVVEAVKH
jgi:hypothetical protein